MALEYFNSVVEQETTHKSCRLTLKGSAKNPYKSFLHQTFISVFVFVFSLTSRFEKGLQKLDKSTTADVKNKTATEIMATAMYQ